MKILKYEAVDGLTMFTDVATEEELRRIAKKDEDRYKKVKNPLPIPGLPRVTFLDMTPEEYYAIPVTNEGHAFWGD